MPNLHRNRTRAARQLAAERNVPYQQALRQLTAGQAGEVTDAGTRVRFTFDPADWEWLKGTFGPLGPFLDVRMLQQLDGQLGAVIDSEYDLTPGQAPEALLLVRFDHWFGQTFWEELEDDEWDAATSEYPVPASALTALPAGTPREYGPGTYAQATAARQLAQAREQLARAEAAMRAAAPSA